MGTRQSNQNRHITIGIIGGGVAGLTLANYLDQVGISYILWEKRCVVEDVGAGVGLIPTGLRILDQLGLYPELAQYYVPHDRWDHRDSDGTLYTSTTAMRSQVDEVGYGPFFVERTRFLQHLYGHIKDRSNIHEYKEVVSVMSDEDKATVVAKDGSSFTCDIVVGADGVHSFVRNAMNAIQPVSSNPQYLATRFSCVYGISNHVKGVDQGRYFSIYRKDISTLIFTGHGGLIFWFVFEDMGKKIPYGEKPRYTQEDTDEICSRVSDLTVTDGVVFADIYANRKTAVMTPLQEGVVNTWFNGRMVLIGDSGHKMVPHAAMGANLAMESVACFINRLNELEKNDLDRPLSEISSIPLDKVEKALAIYAASRTARASPVVGLANFACRSQLKADEEAQAFISSLPTTGRETWLNRSLKGLSLAEKIDGWHEDGERVSQYNKRAKEIREANL